MNYKCFKCDCDKRLWRAVCRNDKLLCEFHLIDNDGKKYSLINDELVQYVPTVIIPHNPIMFYCPTRIPEEAYEKCLIFFLYIKKKVIPKRLFFTLVRFM